MIDKYIRINDLPAHDSLRAEHKLRGALIIHGAEKTCDSFPDANFTTSYMAFEEGEVIIKNDMRDKNVIEIYVSGPCNAKFLENLRSMDDVVREYRGVIDDQSDYEFGRLAFRRYDNDLIVDGKRVQLTPTEHAILGEMVLNAGAPIPFHEMMRDLHISKSSLHTMVSNIRGKIGSCGKHAVETCERASYRFNPEAFL